MWKAWGVQAIKRAFATLDAPERADHTLVVMSVEQGIGKSTFFRTLCPLPRYFRDKLPALGDKDASLAVADAWIVELGEMSHRRRDTDATKAFLTAVKDKVRPPYARFEVEVPRRCVFVGTTNETEFLTDVTGNRRYWVMEARGGLPPSKIEAALRGERDQVWSEVVYMVQAGALPYLPPDMAAEAAVAAEDAREKGVAEEPLRKALARPVDRGSVPLDDALHLSSTGHVLGVSSGKACELIGRDPLDVRVSAAVGRALRALGWVAGKRRAVRRGSGWGSGARLWLPPEGWRYEEGAVTTESGGKLC
jgi:hypothetical protein